MKFKINTLINWENLLRGKVIEFKTTLGYIISPYQKTDMFFAKFSSKDTLDALNKADERMFRCGIEWTVCFGRKICEDQVIPDALLKTKPTVTLASIKRLKAAWAESAESEEPEDERFEMIDRFIQQYCISKFQIERYLEEAKK